MSAIFESIRSQLEDVLFQWDHKEKEYRNTINNLKEENQQLHVSVADLKQEIEFLTKQFEESQSKERKLIMENEKLRLDNAILDTSKNNKRKWKFFN